jgi:hypothetical protein
MTDMAKCDILDAEREIRNAQDTINRIDPDARGGDRTRKNNSCKIDFEMNNIRPEATPDHVFRRARSYSVTALETEHGQLPDTAQAESPSGSIHYLFKHPGFLVKNSVSEIGPGIDVRGDGGMVIAPPSIKPGVGTYKWRKSVAIAEAPQWLLDKIKAGKVEHSLVTALIPDAIDGVSHDGIRYSELCWWIEKKVAGWNSAPETLSNEDWISIGKRIKLSFPGEDGLNAFLAMSWADQHDTITRRWWNPTDFKVEGENLETLRQLRRDSTWMFRDVLGSPRIDAPPLAPIDIPLEILERYKHEREQYVAASIGPLPEHPNLTADQAKVLVKYWAHLPTGKILYESTREMWNASSVDKHIGRSKTR